MRWTGLLWALLAGVLIAMPAHAQGRRPPRAEIVRVDLGWEPTVLTRDRWQPAKVWITSREKSFSGFLTVTFPQDRTQSATVIVGPVATTPGVDTPVEVAISPIRDTREIVFTLTDGRFKTQVKYERDPRGNNPHLPQITMGRSWLGVFVGETSADKVAGGAPVITPNPPAMDPASMRADEALLWQEMILARIGPDRLPMNWVAYESVDMMVCNAADLERLDARVRGAVLKWVQSGGRLVVRTDSVGPVWPGFLSAVAAPVTGTPQAVFAPGPELRALMPRVPESNTFQARLMTLTPEGESRGWKMLYTGSARGEGGATGGLVAYGPVGLGMVTLVTFEPRTVAALIDEDAIRGVWRSIIRRTLPPHAEHAAYPRQYAGIWEPGDAEAEGAINDGLDRLTDVPPIGASVFWAIFLCMLVLAGMIGPFDGIFLRRRRWSQHSWMTALVWIGLASFGALLAPRVMRSGQTVAGRLIVIDRVCDAQGQPVEQAHYALTGVFAGRPVSFGLDGQQPGAWLRGVAAVQQYWGEQRPGRGLPDLQLRVGSDDADVEVRGAWTEQVSVPQWSYRTLSDATPWTPADSGTMGARVQRDGAAWEVTLTNVPEGAHITEAMLRVGDDWYELSGAGAPALNGRDRVFRVSTAVAKDMGDDTPGPESPLQALRAQWTRAEATQGYNYYYGMAGRTAGLPWVRERGQAIDTMLQSGGWACVYANVTGLPMDVQLTGLRNYTARSVEALRILTPLKDAP